MDTPPLQCQICSRPCSEALPFHCITCARNALYEPRLEHAAVLVHREALGKEVSQAVAGTETAQSSLERRSSRSRKDGGPSPRYAMERAISQREESVYQTRLLHEQTETLRPETKRLQTLIAERKKEIALRRTAQESATKAMRREEIDVAGPLQEKIAALEKDSRKIQEHTAEGRTVLCREAASLCGLQSKKHRKGMSGRELYYLGGLPVIDLRDLNNADPAHVNASIFHVAHLLHLTSYYLALRLPAELLLPSASSAYPIIHTPISSYKAPALPAGIRAAAAAASTSASYQQGHSRDRVLHLDRPLHALASDDPRAYGLFVDAVTLLAWDVAWLARTQGLDVGSRNWEELCSIGRTLWLLFVAPPPSSPKPSPRLPIARLAVPSAEESSSVTKTPAPATKLAGLELENPGTVAAPKRGQLTHNSASAFLAAAGNGGGADWMRGWRFASHVRVIDRIKSALASERMGAEWEVLERDEWEAEAVDTQQAKDPSELGEAEGQATLGSRRKSTGIEDRASKLSLQEAAAATEKARKGWTKIRSPAGANT